MFSIGLRYLNGWSIAASDGSAKEQAEWPPHPDRIFMAMAAAWFERGEDQGEESALRWLEDLPPPSIVASDHTERKYTASYVPVNDTRIKRSMVSPNASLGKLKEMGLALLPEYRKREERRFPVAIPHEPTIHLIWNDADPCIYRKSLESLASSVTHVGHSASFVQAWITEDAGIAPTLVPTDGIAKQNLRMFFPGRLDMLTRNYNGANRREYADLNKQLEDLKGVQGKEALAKRKQLKDVIKCRFGKRVPTPVRPTPMLWQRYAPPPEPAAATTYDSVFDANLIILAVKNRRVSLPATLRVIQALRGTVMSHCAKQPPPEWLSGHRPDGSPSTVPHMALIPLPFVDGPYADGRIMGTALVLPAHSNQKEVGDCLDGFLHDAATGLPREHKLFAGQWFELAIALETREDPPTNLQANTWTRPSKTWASVTPVVLDRHFSGKNRWKLAAEGVKDACERIGLPRPQDVLLHPVSLIEGAPPARQYPPVARKRDGGLMVHSHAVMTFGEPVSGPVIVGAGRFRGYGLCRPVRRWRG